MGKIRRGGYLFVTLIGDHVPRHVHIYRDGKAVAKFDLDRFECMTGSIDRRLRRILQQLVTEGKL
ncbi:MAG: DUF4160 domain-containing protein [Desulfurellaceae bacterium]|nr:DUF4160 domain-containing protein [Desulfurellaceae bacterium]